jgi:N-acetylneuraminic acid mutarotase
MKMPLVVLLTMVTCCRGATAAVGSWERLPSMPDREGFAGSYAGVSGGALLVGGGANFPGRKPWEGGTKVWYDAVFVLEQPGGTWKVAGKLPRPLGYGVSVSHGGGVVCVGGNDANGHYAGAFRLDWQRGRLGITDLPPLPRTVANACGVVVGDVLYVAGGLERPDAAAALDTVYRIDLTAPRQGWQALEPMPGGGRMLATAAAVDGALFVAGGVDLFPGPDGKPLRRYLRHVLRFDPRGGWRHVADLPYPLAAAPSPAPSDGSGFYVLGGDDGTQLTTPPNEHRGFRRDIVRYDARNDRWARAGELPAARVTTPCVNWNGAWVVPGGEDRPGVRSPEVWSRVPSAKE